MFFRTLLIVLIGLPCVVLADANNGDFMGYQLGNNYLRGESTRMRVTTTGNLFITAEKPVKPSDVEEVTLLTTPGTLTIGFIDASSWFETEEAARAMGRNYVQLLRAKYPDWEMGQEGLDTHLDVIEINLMNSPYNLRLRLIEEDRNGIDMWRFSMTLGWLRDTEQKQKWRDLAFQQQIAAQQESSRKLLQEADVRGL